MTIHELLKEWEAETKYPVTARTIKMNTYQQNQLLEALSEAVEVLKFYAEGQHLAKCADWVEEGDNAKDLLVKWGVE